MTPLVSKARPAGRQPTSAELDSGGPDGATHGLGPVGFGTGVCPHAAPRRALRRRRRRCRRPHRPGSRAGRTLRTRGSGVPVPGTALDRALSSAAPAGRRCRLRPAAARTAPRGPAGLRGGGHDDPRHRGRGDAARGRAGGARGRTWSRSAAADGPGGRGRRRARPGCTHGRLALDGGEVVEALGERLVSVNAHLGADANRPALATGAQIAIAGRVGDPEPFLAPLMHAFGSAAVDRPRLGQGACLDYPRGCAAQVSGGCIAARACSPCRASTKSASRLPRCAPTARPRRARQDPERRRARAAAGSARPVQCSTPCGADGPAELPSWPGANRSDPEWYGEDLQRRYGGKGAVP